VTSITEWIIEQVATRTGVPASSVDPGVRFKSLGLGSLDVTSILSQLSAMVGRPLSPTLGWEYPTPEALGRHLSAPIRQIARIAPRDIFNSADEPIAIVGLSCRFPRATDKESFWALLRDGVDAIGEVPKDRWDLDSLYDPDPSAPGKMATRWGGFLDEVDRFDPIFFGIAPREAVQMDPQRRLALELSWEALEDAGIVPATLLDSRTGVFLGAMWMDYARLAVGAGEQIVQHTATGLDLSIIAARISYTLGAVGPSLTVNTACSSSLVALHHACEAIRSGTTLALAGGVNLLLAPEARSR
jgi:acyl transferase domain-containing protein